MALKDALKKLTVHYRCHVIKVSTTDKELKSCWGSTSTRKKLLTTKQGLRISLHISSCYLKYSFFIVTFKGSVHIWKKHLTMCVKQKNVFISSVLCKIFSSRLDSNGWRKVFLKPWHLNKLSKTLFGHGVFTDRCTASVFKNTKDGDDLKVWRCKRIVLHDP